MNSVEDLRRECVEVEKIFGRKDKNNPQSAPTNRYTWQVNEIFEKPNSTITEPLEVDAMEIDTPTKKPTDMLELQAKWSCVHGLSVF